MTARLDEARALLRRLKQDYQIKLKQVDALLRVAVAQDPDALVAARSIQDEYGTELSSAVLAGWTQPLGPPPAETIITIDEDGRVDPPTGGPLRDPEGQ